MNKSTDPSAAVNWIQDTWEKGGPPVAAELCGDRRPADPPPACNTGAEFQAEGAGGAETQEAGGVVQHGDYLTLTAWADLADLKQWVADLFGMGPWTWQALPHGKHGYRACELGAWGVCLLSNPAAGTGYATVQVSGEAWAVLSWPKVFAALDRLDGKGVRWQATRLDLAFDHELFTPADINAEWKADKLEPGSRVRSLVKRTSGRFIQNDDGEGETREIGSRCSNRFLRVYRRRDAEGVRLLTRVELEIKGRPADAILRDLRATGQAGGNVEQRAMGHLLDFIDFTRASWWGRFRKSVGRAAFKVTLTKAKKTVGEAIEWIERQCLPTVAMILAALGGDESWLHEGIGEAFRRLSDKQRHVIAWMQEEAAAFCGVLATPRVVT